jgi:hypothetical protein
MSATGAPIIEVASIKHFDLLRVTDRENRLIFALRETKPDIARDTASSYELLGIVLKELTSLTGATTILGRHGLTAIYSEDSAREDRKP